MVTTHCWVLYGDTKFITVYSQQAGDPDMLRLPEAAKTIPNVARDKPLPFSYRIWKALRIFRRDDVKFAIKVGGGAAIYALPAFIPSTRPIFAYVYLPYAIGLISLTISASYWRGEWGLVSYMIGVYT